MKRRPHSPVSVRAVVLLTLASGPAHGLGIIASARKVSRGGVDLNEGAVYPMLDTLEAEGLARLHEIERVYPRGGRARRVMRLTPKGYRVAADLELLFRRLLDA